MDFLKKIWLKVSSLLTFLKVRPRLAGFFGFLLALLGFSFLLGFVDSLVISFVPKPTYFVLTQVFSSLFFFFIGGWCMYTSVLYLEKTRDFEKIFEINISKIRDLGGRHLIKSSFMKEKIQQIINGIIEDKRLELIEIFEDEQKYLNEMKEADSEDKIFFYSDYLNEILSAKEEAKKEFWKACNVAHFFGFKVPVSVKESALQKKEAKKAKTDN